MTRLVLVLFLLATGLPALPGSLLGAPEEILPGENDGDRVDLLLFEGELLLEDGHILEALEQFQEAVRLDPERFEARLYLARALTTGLLAGQIDPATGTQRALAAYRWILDRQPEHVEARRGEELLRQRFRIQSGPRFETERAQELWDEALRAAENVDPDAQRRALDALVREAPRSVAALRARGDFHEAQGRLGKAIDDYKRAARIAPRSVGTRARLGDLLQARGREDQALREYETALDLSSGYEPAADGIRKILESRPPEKLSARERGLLGRTALASRDLDRAVELLTEAVGQDPRFQHRRALAVAHFLRGDDEKALSLFRDLREDRPDDPEILYYLGSIDLRQGRTERGRDLLRQVLEQDPNDASALRMLGLSLSEERGQEEEAIHVLLRAEVAGAEFDGLSCILGMLYLRTGLQQRAYTELSNCLLESPDFHEAHLGLGMVADDRGDKGEAIKHFETYLEFEPGPDPAAVFRLGVAYLRAGRDERGFETLRRMLVLMDSTAAEREPPAETSLLEMTTFFLASTRRFEDAIFIGEMLLTKDPENSIYNNNLAMAYADADQNLERALALARKANRLSPDNPGHLDTLGWALLRLQRFEEAERSLKESLRLAEGLEDPGNLSEIYFHLGALYRMTGRRAEARETLARALENPPTPFLRAVIEREMERIEEDGDR